MPATDTTTTTARSSRSILGRVGFRRLAAASVLIASASIVLAGCSRPGGVIGSRDRHNYQSTAMEPKTVRVLDARSGEVLWSLDVPVGQTLSIQFDDNKFDSVTLPDRMKWGTAPIGDGVSMDEEIQVPPADSRRIEWDIRNIPEYPTEPAATEEG